MLPVVTAPSVILIRIEISNALTCLFLSVLKRELRIQLPCYAFTLDSAGLWLKVK